MGMSRAVAVRHGGGVVSLAWARLLQRRLAAYEALPTGSVGRLLGQRPCGLGDSSDEPLDARCPGGSAIPPGRKSCGVIRRGCAPGGGGCRASRPLFVCPWGALCQGWAACRQGAGFLACRPSTFGCDTRGVARASTPSATGSAFKRKVRLRVAGRGVARPSGPSSRPKHCLRNAPAEASGTPPRHGRHPTPPCSRRRRKKGSSPCR